LIDCTNPIDEADSFRLVTADGPSMASAIAQACPGAHVAKAFNLGSAGLWQMTPPRTADGPIVVPIAANSDHALRVTSELVEAVGCVPFPWGPLDRADQIEAVAAFGIRLIVEGLTFDSVMPTTQPGPPPGT
jgi:8-hydroxy-5-deazaflavin:NADPH oxidoreductase